MTSAPHGRGPGRSGERSSVGLRFCPEGQSEGLANTERRGLLPAGGVQDLGIHMTLIRTFLGDDRGASSTQVALMIGLSASAVLVLVRVALAAVGQ